MDATRSQAGVFYVSNSEANALRLLSVSGLTRDNMVADIHLSRRITCWPRPRWPGLPE